MKKLGEKLGVDLPITNAVYEVCFKEGPLNAEAGKELCMEMLAKLFSRDTKFEF